MLTVLADVVMLVSVVKTRPYGLGYVKGDVLVLNSGMDVYLVHVFYDYLYF